MSRFSQLFSLGRASVIAMIHIRALPGTPMNKLSLEEIVDKACHEATTLKQYGFDGFIIENMHDLPYTLRPGHEITASMAVICAKVRSLCPDLPIGVQILAGANVQALAVAQASNLDFIRSEGFVFAHVADEGVIQACAGDLLRYRRSIGAENVAILSDIKKKHSSHAITADVSLSETGQAAELFLSDGLIVTGASTGDPAKPDDITKVKACSRLPVLVGSGVTRTNLGEYLNADGLIIGSHLKKNGDWREELDENRINDFMNEFKRRTLE